MPIQTLQALVSHAVAQVIKSFLRNQYEHVFKDHQHVMYGLKSSEVLFLPSN